MNKTELIAAVAEKAELSKKDAEKAVKAFTDAVAEELVRAAKYSWLALVLSRLLRGLLERVGILRLVTLCLSLLPRHQSSKQARH